MKTKQISKDHKGKKVSKKPITNQQGDPLIKNLSDFVTSLKIQYTNKPIYTGGRFITMQKNIYSSCNDQISIYSLQTGCIIDKIKHINQQIVNFVIDPSQSNIITFTQSGLLRTIQLQTKKILFTSRYNNMFANDMQYSPDGKHLAIAFGNTIHIYTTETMSRTHSYNPTNSKFVVSRLHWNPQGQKLQIATLDMARNLAIFDYIINKVIHVAGQAGTQFSYTNQGNIVTVNNQSVHVYDKKLQLIDKIQSQQYFQYVHAIDNNVFLGGQDTQLYSFTIPNGKLKSHPQCTDNGITKIMSNGHQSNRKLMVLSTQQNLTILNIASQNIKNPIFQGMIIGYNDQIIDIKNSKTQQSSYFVMVTNSNNIKLINSNTHRLQKLIKGHQNTVLCVDYFHPYIASSGKDNIIKLWKIVQNKDSPLKVQLLANFYGHSADVVSIVALPNSNILASVSQDLSLKLWSLPLTESKVVNIKSALRTIKAHQKPINSVRIDPKQELIATSSQDKTIKIWDLNLNNLMTFSGHKKGVWDTSFHPHQKIIISAGGQGQLKCWNLINGQCMWSMGQGPAIIRCQWIYYNQIVTGSLSGIVKVWDVRKQTSLTYDKHEGKIWALDVTKKNQQVKILSGGTDSIYHVWSDNTKQMKENIMHQNQMQQQQKIFYNQYMLDKNYTQAAVVAFKANYIKLFLNVMVKIGCKIDAEMQVQIDSQNKLMIKQQQQIVTINQEQFQQMVKSLKQIDLNRLLITIQTMLSSVKHYKIGNKILLILFKILSINQIIQYDRTFILPNNQKQDLMQFNQKKSSLVKLIQNLINYQQKHQSRINKYISGTHWIQHLHRQVNPWAAF